MWRVWQWRPNNMWVRMMVKVVLKIACHKTHWMKVYHVSVRDKSISKFEKAIWSSHHHLLVSQMSVKLSLSELWKIQIWHCMTKRKAEKMIKITCSAWCRFPHRCKSTLQLNVVKVFIEMEWSLKHQAGHGVQQMPGPQHQSTPLTPLSLWYHQQQQDYP